MSLDVFTKELTTVELDNLDQIDEMGQVTIYCSCKPSENIYIRIWQTTYLFDNASDHVSKLVHTDNISLFPKWKLVQAGKKHVFILIFSGLPKTCTSFDFIEDIPENGGFVYRNIARNNTDVYHLEF